MPDLVIEKDVGAETLEESPLFFSSKEQCLIDAYAPAPECLDDTLVRWREGVQYMKANGVDTLVECGTGKVLSGLVKRIDRDMTGLALNTPADIEAFLKTA